MLWIVILGVVTGARSMTAIAVLCWAARLGWLPLAGTWAAWMGSPISVGVFTLFALGEYVGDTLPKTPSRASAFPAIARFAFGALVGAGAATAIHEPVAGGVISGMIGAAIGTYGGVWLRKTLATAVGTDLPIALAESALVLVLAVLSVRALSHEVLMVADHAALLLLRAIF